MSLRTAMVLVVVVLVVIMTSGHFEWASVATKTSSPRMVQQSPHGPAPRELWAILKGAMELWQVGMLNKLSSTLQ